MTKLKCIIKQTKIKEGRHIGTRNKKNLIQLRELSLLKGTHIWTRNKIESRSVISKKKKLKRNIGGKNRDRVELLKQEEKCKREGFV